MKNTMKVLVLVAAVLIESGNTGRAQQVKEPVFGTLKSGHGFAVAPNSTPNVISLGVGEVFVLTQVCAQSSAGTSSPVPLYSLSVGPLVVPVGSNGVPVCQTFIPGYVITQTFNCQQGTNPNGSGYICDVTGVVVKVPQQ